MHRLHRKNAGVTQLDAAVASELRHGLGGNVQDRGASSSSSSSTTMAGSQAGAAAAGGGRRRRSSAWAVKQQTMLREEKQEVETFEAKYPFTEISADVVEATKQTFLIVSDLYASLPRIEKVKDKKVERDATREDGRELRFTFDVSSGVHEVWAESALSWVVATDDIEVFRQGTTCELTLVPRPGIVAMTGITIYAVDIVGRSSRTFIVNVVEPKHAELLRDVEEEQRLADEGRDASLWSCAKVCNFLKSLGFANKVALFRKKDVNGKKLLGLSDDDLKNQVGGVLASFFARHLMSNGTLASDP